MSRRRTRRNPSAKVVGLSLGGLAIAGVATWYFFLRKPAVAYAQPTLMQQAIQQVPTSPANPLRLATVNSVQNLLQTLPGAIAAK
jgi:hypothetical protein